MPRQVTIPLQVLLQWDEEGNDRQLAVDLFDALGSEEKTLHASLGGHTGVPSYELDPTARFFARHLTSDLLPGSGVWSAHVELGHHGSVVRRHR